MGIAAEHGADVLDSVRTARDGKIRIVLRDSAREQAFASYLDQVPGLFGTVHHVPGVPRQRAAFHFVHGDSRTEWLNFLHRHVPTLREQGWRIDIDAAFTERFRLAEVDEAPLDAEFRGQEGSWWFSLDRFAEIANADFVLSTYPLLTRDQEHLLPVEWHMVVLDEAQAIKIQRRA